MGVPSLLQELLRLLEVRLEHARHAGRRLERCAAAEHGLAHLVIARIADDGLQEILLVERQCRGMAVAHVVERRLLPVEAQHIGRAERVGHDDLDVLVLLQHRQQVVRRSFDHVDFARQESVDLGLAIGDPCPFDAIELGDLAAGQA